VLFLSLRFLHASRFFSGALSAAVFAVYSAGVEPVNAQAPTYKVTEMRPLSGLEAGFNRVHDLNESGQIVGYTSATFNLEQSTPRYFLFNGTNTVEVSVSSGSWSRGASLALNNRGHIAGTNGSNTGAQAFLNNGLGVFNLGTLGGTRSYAADINDNGVVVGRSTVAGDGSERAFVYSGGTMIDLGTLGGSRSSASSINSAGHVVGSADLANNAGSRAFLYRNGVMTNLGTFGGNSSSASASNTAGQVVGTANYANYDRYAFRYTNGVMQNIDTLGRDSSAIDINEAGDAIGNSYVLSGSSRVLTGFVFRGNGPAQALTPHIGAVSQAKDINNKGQVVGSASGWAGWGDNQSRGFLHHQGMLYDLNSLIAPNSGYFIFDALRINDKGQIAAVATKNGQQRVLLLSFSNAPFANPDAVTVEEDSSDILIRVLDNDTDPNGNPLRISWLTPPGQNGHWGVTNNSTTISYIPRPDFYGTETIYYDVTNGSAEARSYVTITVTPRPDAPVAGNSRITTNEDTAAKIALSAWDADGDALTYSITRQPSHGTLNAGSAAFAAGPNSFTYIPNANYNGLDSFEFKASDGTLESNTARVDITVKPVSDKPVANAQSVETDEDTAKAITLSGTDVDGDTLTYAIVSNPQHGTLTGDTPN
jgi:probable HAF family extracellular repeat protein